MDKYMKQYDTPEECLAINGEHAWRELPRSHVSCLVLHPDGYCPLNDKKEKCYHCPALRQYTRQQSEIFSWVDI